MHASSGPVVPSASFGTNASRWLAVLSFGLGIGLFSATASTTVSNVTLASGQTKVVSDAGEITTAESSSGPTVKVQSGATLVLWSGTNVVLNPGFQSEEGSYFWGAVDHDMNGYSDMEEQTDTDGDGMPDAWEVDHGLNPLDPSDAASDRNGDGVTNLAEYKASTLKTSAAALPTGYQLVLCTPSGQYYGVNTSTWAIDPVGGP